MSNYNFFTFFSVDYAPRAQILHQSLLKHQKSFQFYCCFLDKESEELALSMSTSDPFSISEVLASNQLLKQRVTERERADGIFSSVPSMILHALGKIPAQELLIYLDADTKAFSHFGPVHGVMHGHSVGLFPHDFLKPFSFFLNRYGKFNAGAIVIRNDQRGREFLKAWENLCIEWCNDRVSGKNYSNQAYLTHLWSESSESVAILGGLGGNVAPWNSGFLNTQVKNGKVLHRGRKLVFFHFHGLVFSTDYWSVGHLRYFRVLRRKVLEALYFDYINDLETAHRLLNLQLTNSSRTRSDFPSRAVSALLGILSRILRQTTKR